MAGTNLISFSRGAPSIDLVDIEGLKTAAQTALSEDPAGVTGYGTSVGYAPLRKLIAEKHDVAPEQVIVTNGSMQADAFLFDLLVSKGDDVVVERPTYDRTLLGLTARGANVHAIELERDGLNVEALRELLESGVRPTLAHIIPNFHNPGGCTLGAGKRLELLELARQYDFKVFEDDPYIDIRFHGTSLPTMLSSATGGEVYYASSFSKTVCPGVRVGYLIGPREGIAKIYKAATNTYIAPNMLAQATVYQFWKSGALERSIETVKSALVSRADLLCEQLNAQLPDAEHDCPEGGYFLWVTLPEGVSAQELVERAKTLNVALVPGTDFELDGGQRSFRLAYSGVTEDQIREGVKRLAEAYRALQPTAA